MRFLLDVNVGATVARALMEADHDVLRAVDVAARDEDPEVLARAVAEDRIITYDRDFGELAFHRTGALPPAIIYIRYEPDEVAEIVNRLMPLLDFDLLRHHMTVIDRRRIRRTPFPIEGNANG